MRLVLGAAAIVVSVAGIVLIIIGARNNDSESSGVGCIMVISAWAVVRLQKK